MGAMLEFWDFTVLCIRFYDWVTGNSDNNWVLGHNGFVYKGSAMVGLMTLVLSYLRSKNRTSCSEPNPGSRCSYDVNPTYKQQWINRGIYEETIDCLAAGFELLFLAWKTHAFAPVDFEYICVDPETGEPMACSEWHEDDYEHHEEEEPEEEVCVDEVTGERVECEN